MNNQLKSFISFKNFRLLKSPSTLKFYKLPILEISPVVLSKIKKDSTRDIYSLTSSRAMVGIILSGIMIFYMAKLLLSFGGIWVILGSVVLISIVIGFNISLKVAFLYSWLRRYSS